MPKFESFDRRRYPTLSAREGYARWAPTYEATIKADMDERLLERVESVDFAQVERAADLGCGTGRTGAWLAGRGVRAIDGVDLTPEMLERARARRVFERLELADVSATRLPARAYDLITTVLVDEHLARLEPLYRESARIARPGAAHVVVGFHPFFIMRSGMPTHFDDAAGAPHAIETHVHLFSDHVQAAQAAGWGLAEMHEQLIDDAWIARKPSWAALRDVPVSFAIVWRRQLGSGTDC
ncbi:MAG TPA: class I SAM-dependent methyltransferase [Myxococcota bacterium]|nr:class I SAM-dependent methyltransferase [Myxococcota bacterium]